MAPGTFEYFFDLPPELREQILSHVCLFPPGVLVGGGTDGRTVSLPIRASPALSTAHAATTSKRHYGGGGGADGETAADGESAELPAGPPVNLFLASPVLYREAGDLYYGRNVFHLDFTAASWGRRQQRIRVVGATSTTGYATTGSVTESGSRGEGRTGAGMGPGTGTGTGLAAAMRLLTHPATANARRRLRSVSVRVRRLGALMLDVLVPALRDAVLNGALRRVRVDVLEAGVTGAVSLGQERRLRALDHGGNPALRALLVLLTDPDMERAELRVPRWLHAPFWCHFHGGMVSEGGDSAGCAMAGRQGRGWKGGDCGDEFLQVDIHRLVEACAGGGDAAEFRIKKAGFGCQRMAVGP